jgi:hypothetical protein
MIQSIECGTIISKRGSVFIIFLSHVPIGTFTISLSNKSGLWPKQNYICWNPDFHVITCMIFFFYYLPPFFFLHSPFQPICNANYIHYFTAWNSINRLRRVNPSFWRRKKVRTTTMMFLNTRYFLSNYDGVSLSSEYWDQWIPSLIILILWIILLTSTSVTCNYFVYINFK